MKKRNYTHVQMLLPEIKAMLAKGKTQREVAEYYGFRDKQVVKDYLSVSAEKNESWRPESAHSRKDGREKMLRQEMLWQSRPMRSNGFAWKINYCGIFCASQKGSESKGKLSYHLSSIGQSIQWKSCANSLECPEAATMLLSIVWVGMNRTRLLRK